MKTFLKTSILVLSLVVGFQFNVNAQMVYIPDPQFRAYLNQNYPGSLQGDSVNSAFPGISTAKHVVVSNWFITDLTGIDIFVNDSSLSTQNNQLTTLPNLPSNLQVLNCNSNLITSLPALPNTIKTLVLTDNDLTAISSLPSSLQFLNCSRNQIASLPTLPTSLKILYSDNNQLSSLPTLPLSLKTLSISANLFSSLPALPDSLTYLTCYSNQITALPALPNVLATLGCGSNQLTALPTLPDSLKDLQCQYNLITALPSLPAALRELNCASNDLTNLPALSDSMLMLTCYDNQLSTLPQLNSKINQINCRNNSIDSLPAFVSSLRSIDCSENQLTELPNLNIGLTNLTCYTNYLSDLPVLPESLKNLICNSNAISCLPDLKNVQNLNIASTLITCLPNYGDLYYCTPPLASFQLCDVFNTNGCEVFWNIEGTSYNDLDTNCLLGVNDIRYHDLKINLYKNGVLDQSTYTNPYGEYSLNTSQYDLYKTELDTLGTPFNIVCPVTEFYLDSITATDSIKHDRDFALKCKGMDLAATSIYTTDLRPATYRTVNVQAGDLSYLFGAHCATGISGVVTIRIFGDANYYSPTGYSLTPSSVVGKTIKYNVADFGVLSYDSTFDFVMLLDTTAKLGEQICFTVTISTPSQELSCSNNSIKQCFTIISSHDPNDKTAYPATTLDISGNKWLNYIVRFQNTGTANAEHVYITDTLSDKLDISTFTMLSYSHQPFVQIYSDGLLKFNFPFINLPDSNANEPESHGYVQFKIKAKDSLTIGSTIDNTANIYFDFNAPVITNTTSNILINCNIPTTILNATICDGEAYILNDIEYYYGGVYQQNILTAFGCDSVVELRLTVNTINNTITQSAGTLQTTASATNYQWINCTTGTAIVGANTQTYNPTQSGNYSVVVDFGTCKDTSACYNFSPVGLNEINASNISIQPNPFNHELKVTLDRNFSGFIEVYNTIGEMITNEKLQSRNVTLNTSNWNAGVYILKVATNDGVVVKKVIKR